MAYVDDKIFKLSVIPHTQSETTLLLKSVGSEINIETDIIGKYVEKFTRSESRITMDFLRENGF